MPYNNIQSRTDMMLSCASAVLAVVISVLGLGGYAGVAARAQTNDVAFAFDRASYLEDTDATVSVSHLDTCVGQPVELGLYSAAPLPLHSDAAAIAVQPVTISQAGEGSVVVRVPFGGTTARAGVRGACVPGGILGSEQVVALLPRDQGATPTLIASPTVGSPAATTQTPLPPSTGNGARSAGASSFDVFCIAMVAWGAFCIAAALYLGEAAFKRLWRLED